MDDGPKPLSEATGSLNLIITRHNKTDRPLGAFCFSVSLTKAMNAGLELEIPASCAQAPYLSSYNHKGS